MLRDKYGQIRMSETIAVIFIFFVLILFGIIFYFKYSQIAAKEQQQELLASRAMDTTLRTLFLPELLCGKGEAEPEDNCIDMLKARSVNATFKTHLDEYYFNIFGYGKVTLTPVYPPGSPLVLYEKVKPDWERKEPTFFVVTLRDEIAGNENAAYGFGYLNVEVYS